MASKTYYSEDEKAFDRKENAKWHPKPSEDNIYPFIKKKKKSYDDEKEEKSVWLRGVK